MIAILSCCTLDLSAQELTIDVSHGIVASKDAPFVFEDGKWVPGENSKPSGELSMLLTFDGKKSSFDYAVTGTEVFDGKTYFQCDNDKYFSIENDRAVPFIAEITLIPYQNSADAIEAFKNEESKDIAWAIWLLQSQGK